MMFLAAGYETTSAAIAKITHDLAVHQDLQRKVQQEIDENFPGEVMYIIPKCTCFSNLTDSWSSA